MGGRSAPTSKGAEGGASAKCPGIYITDVMLQNGAALSRAGVGDPLGTRRGAVGNIQGGPFSGASQLRSPEGRSWEEKKVETKEPPKNKKKKERTQQKL